MVGVGQHVSFPGQVTPREIAKLRRALGRLLRRADARAGLHSVRPPTATRGSDPHGVAPPQFGVQGAAGQELLDVPDALELRTLELLEPQAVLTVRLVHNI